VARSPAALSRVAGVVNEEQACQVLAQQLAMNKQSWAALQEYGVTDESELRLDFFYVAPSQAEAEGLRTFIEAETDYDVRVGSQGGGFMKKKTWLVTGTTQPTKVTQEILDEWVAWMVAAGFEHGGCEFDGWGAQAG
jgi:hypothetical protein